MKLSDVRATGRKVREGVWVDAGRIKTVLTGVQLRVRGAGNPDDRRIQAREYARLADPQGNLPEGAAAEIDGIRISEALLVDWFGLTGDDDQPLPFSPELAEQVASDPDLLPIRDAVVKGEENMCRRGGVIVYQLAQR